MCLGRLTTKKKKGDKNVTKFQKQNTGYHY